MKNLSLFVTLSLLTIISTYTIVKANPSGDNLNQSQDPNCVIISDKKVDSLEEVQP